MWPGVFVCVHACTCVSVWVLSFVSSQLNLAKIPPHLQSSSFPSLPLLFLLISLSDEQIELLNELFLWAPNAHPQLSICSFPLSVRLSLPPSTHPSILLFPRTHLLYHHHLPAATMFISTGTRVRTCTHVHSHLYNALMCVHIITCCR